MRMWKYISLLVMSVLNHCDVLMMKQLHCYWMLVQKISHLLDLRRLPLMLILLHLFCSRLVLYNNEIVMIKTIAGRNHTHCYPDIESDYFNAKQTQIVTLPHVQISLLRVYEHTHYDSRFLNWRAPEGRIFVRFQYPSSTSCKLFSFLQTTHILQVQ